MATALAKAVVETTLPEIAAARRSELLLPLPFFGHLVIVDSDWDPVKDFSTATCCGITMTSCELKHWLRARHSNSLGLPPSHALMWSCVFYVWNEQMLQLFKKGARAWSRCLLQNNFPLGINKVFLILILTLKVAHSNLVEIWNEWILWTQNCLLTDIYYKPLQRDQTDYRIPWNLHVWHWTTVSQYIWKFRTEKVYKLSLAKQTCSA